MNAVPQNVTVTHNDNPPFERVITLKHELIEGRHFFTSNEIFGFCIASSNFEKAKAQICPVIEELLRQNHNLNCTATFLPRGLTAIPAGEPEFVVVKKAA